MLTIYDAAGNGLATCSGAEAIAGSTVWIDLLNPTPEEDVAVERALGISVPTRAEMREIEASNRLYVENGAFYMTAFIIHAIEQAVPVSSTVTFIIAGNRLVTVRYAEPKAFPQYLPFHRGPLSLSYDPYYVAPTETETTTTATTETPAATGPVKTTKQP